MTIRQVQLRVIIVGLIAAVLTQYAWLFPIPHIYEVFAAVAAVCAFIAFMLLLLAKD